MRKPDDEEGNGSGWDRRQFGKAVVAGVGALTVGRAAGAQLNPPSAPSGRSTGKNDYDVVIVGAGLSGLIAAREFTRAHKKVLVLEANCRIGGRMYRQATKIKNSYVDIGGQWVGETQYEMQALAAELGITPFESYENGRSVQLFVNPTGGEKRTGFNGDLSKVLEGKCVAPNTFPKDTATCQVTTLQNCGFDRDEQYVWGKLLEISRTVPPDRPWDTPGANDLDGKLFSDWLKERIGELNQQRADNDKPPTDYTAWLPTLQARIGGSGGFEPKDVSVLHMAWTQRVGPQSEIPEKWLLCGGAGQIPYRLANDVGWDNIRLNMPVEFIQQQENGGVLVAAKGQAFRARSVIVAIPPPLRNQIKYETQYFSQVTPNRAFNEGSFMGSMAKVHAIYERAFWRDECLSGSGASNLKTCQFIADSSPPGGSPGILTSFIAADRNKQLTKCFDDLHYTDDDVKCAVRELVIQDYVRYFGNNEKVARAVRDNLKDFIYFNWDKQPYTGGAYTSYVRPGTWSSFGREGWRQPIGDIFWAGTETADRWPGYLDGAIRAGKAAATAVLLKWFEQPLEENASCAIPTSDSNEKAAIACTPSAGSDPTCQPPNTSFETVCKPVPVTNP
jgi:monoamine oxidase